MKSYLTTIDIFEQKVTGSFRENNILLKIPEKIKGKLRTGLMKKSEDQHSNLQPML